MERHNRSLWADTGFLVHAVIAAPMVLTAFLAAGAYSPALSEEKFSSEDKRTIVSGFLATAARLDAGDMHSHLTGLMGLIPASRRSPLFDFVLGGKADDPASSSSSSSGSGTSSTDAGSTGSGGTSGQTQTSTPAPQTSRSTTTPRTVSSRQRTRSAYYRRRAAQRMARYRRYLEWLRKRRQAGFVTDNEIAESVNSLASTFGFSGSLGPDATFDLETSRQVVADRLGLTQDDALREPGNFNMWVSAHNANNPAFTPVKVPGVPERAGRWSFSTGAHYKLAPDLTVGALFRTRAALGNATPLSSTTDLQGFGVGVYSGVALSDNIAVSALGFYERGNNTVTIDAARGEYTSDHMSLSANLKGFWREGNWWFSPSASVTWTHTSASRFTDSSGADVAGSAAETGHVSMGPQIGYVFFGDKYVRAIRPHVSVSGVYSFLDSGSQALTNGSISGADGLYGQITGGVDIWLNNKMSMEFDMGYDGIGSSDLAAWTMQGRLSVPLN